MPLNKSKDQSQSNTLDLLWDTYCQCLRNW